MVSTLTEAQVWSALEAVKDPEIPVLSVVDLGVIRRVSMDGGHVVVDMTPTFAGCPALDVMREEVEARVRQTGAASVVVNVVLSPPWSTDWITEEGRRQLAEFGLAPPRRHGGLIQLILDETAACPHCGSDHTRVTNHFGPTLCRAIYYCDDCQQPFEKIKGL
jgi:ring-1,2-phenylacetyl-CoA epoxidase subunit PaaD